MQKPSLGRDNSLSTIETLLSNSEFFRGRTLGLLERIEKDADVNAALGFRPGPGRAPIAWQLMHIGITEEIFASERLYPEQTRSFTELWPRYRGGSVPDDMIPTAGEIRDVLGRSRELLKATCGRFTDEQLGWIPDALKERGLTLLDVLKIIGFHEAHHQGQAHLTFNLYLNR